MEGIEESVADPIAPVTPDDDRPVVKDLLKEHADKIAKIKTSLVDHPLYEETKHDDLWILRFWLSHKKSKAAIDAAKHTLEFRKEHNLDDKDIRSLAPHQVPSGKVREYLDCWENDAMTFTHPHPQRGVIAFLKISSMNQHAVVEKLTEDYWLAIFMYCTEWSFQWLDYVTRTTGRLTKSARFIDLSGLGVSMMNRECSRRDGAAMGLMEDCYPQLLESIFACNGPTVLDALWRIVKVLLPKRVVTKFSFMKPKEREGDRKRLYKHLSQEDLPDFYGGDNKVPPQDWKNETFPEGDEPTN